MVVWESLAIHVLEDSDDYRRLLDRGWTVIDRSDLSQDLSGHPVARKMIVMRNFKEEEEK